MNDANSPNETTSADGRTRNGVSPPLIFLALLVTAVAAAGAALRGRGTQVEGAGRYVGGGRALSQKARFFFGLPMRLGAMTARDFELIDGVGPRTAERIMQLKKERGKIGGVEELDEVKGVGPATLEKLRKHIE